jgi:Transposase
MRAIRNFYEGMAMTRMAQPRCVIGGVDTHKDNHVAAIVDEAGRILGTNSFPNHAKGFRQLRVWMSGFGVIDRVGIEGTGPTVLDCRAISLGPGSRCLRCAVTIGSAAG